MPDGTPPTYLDGSVCYFGGTPYGHCNRNCGMFYNDSAVKDVHIRDGKSSTAMLCEVWGRVLGERGSPADGPSRLSVLRRQPRDEPPRGGLF